MIPLACARPIDSTQALTEAIGKGFERYGITAREVTASGGAFPTIDALRIDLTNAKLNREMRPPGKASGDGPEIRIESLEVKAHPLLLEDAPVELDLRATGAVARLVSGNGEEALLVPQSAAEGQVSVSIRNADLEHLLQTAASMAAAKHGVEIKETHVSLTARGNRGLTFRAEVVAKVFFAKAPVALTGEADLDESLNLQLSKLAFEGSGMVANLAGGFIRPHLDKLQEKPISLGAFALGQMRLQDITISTTDGIAIQAKLAAG